jgi:hypothetical protein
MPPTSAPAATRYDPDTYHERRSPSPIADRHMDYVALQHEFLTHLERLLAEAETTRTLMVRLNRMNGTLSLLTQQLEAERDRRMKKTGPPLRTTGPASPGEPS